MYRQLLLTRVRMKRSCGTDKFVTPKEPSPPSTPYHLEVYRPTDRRMLLTPGLGQSSHHTPVEGTEKTKTDQKAYRHGVRLCK